MWMARGRRKCSGGLLAMRGAVCGQRSRGLRVRLRAKEEMGSVVEGDAVVVLLGAVGYRGWLTGTWREVASSMEGG